MHGLRRPVSRSVVLLKNKEVARQVANGRQKLLMKQDISIILAVHLCTLIIGVNPAGDAGDVSPPIFWLVGTSMGMSPPIFGVAM